jgi:hypothetical protein
VVKEPFRRGLGYAMQWYDHLQVQITQGIDNALEVCERQACKFMRAGDKQAQNSGEVPGGDPASVLEVPPSTLTLPLKSTAQPPPTRHPFELECDRTLQRLCPACFGGKEFGIPFDK